MQWGLPSTQQSADNYKVQATNWFWTTWTSLQSGGGLYKNDVIIEPKNTKTKSFSVIHHHFANKPPLPRCWFGFNTKVLPLNTGFQPQKYHTSRMIKYYCKFRGNPAFQPIFLILFLGLLHLAYQPKPIEKCLFFGSDSSPIQQNFPSNDITFNQAAPN